MAYEVFKERLREIREARGLSQTELANKISVSKTSVYTYELGTKKPSFEIAANIAKACGTSLDWLCGLYESEDNKINNVSEVLKLFFKIIKSGVVKIELNGFAIEENFREFFFSCFGTVNMYQRGIICEELFDLWCNNEIKKYQNVFVKKDID